MGLLNAAGPIYSFQEAAPRLMLNERNDMEKPELKLRLRTKAAANYIGLSKSTLEKYRIYGTGPAYAKMGRVVIYRGEDLDKWIDSNIRRSTSEY